MYSEVTGISLLRQKYIQQQMAKHNSTVLRFTPTARFGHVVAKVTAYDFPGDS